MKIGIIAAMDVEAARYLEIMENLKTENIGKMEFSIGNIGEHEIVLARCGVGKVNAAATATVLCSHFNVDCVINSGIAGGMDDRIKPFDIVIASELVAHDTNPRISEDYFPFAFVYKTDEKLRDMVIESMKARDINNYFVGRIATGDMFIEDSVAKADIKARTNPLCVEMEGQAIAQACYIFDTPFLGFRTISDSGDDDTNTDYDNFFEKAANQSADLVIGFLKD